MKVRIKFSKSGSMVYIGHLDIMRYFQKAIRRSGLPIKYSEGFNPHQIMSFAAPLGVGLSSSGEYMDIELKEFVPSQEALQRLQAAMVDGMEVTSFRYLPDNTKNAMSSVSAASYILSYKHPEKFPYTITELQAAKKAFFDDAGTIPIIKKTKKGERELDLKPLIYDFTISEVCNSCGDSGIIFSLLVSTGSTDNIKPELVLDHFFRSMGKTDLGRYDFFIHREDMLTGQAPDFVSLGEIGHDKE